MVPAAEAATAGVTVPDEVVLKPPDIVADQNAGEAAQMPPGEVAAVPHPV